MSVRQYSRFLVNSIVLVTLVAAGRPGFARDKAETIDARHLAREPKWVKTLA